MKLKMSSSSSSLSSAGDRPRSSTFYCDADKASSTNDEMTSNQFTSLESAIQAPTNLIPQQPAAAMLRPQSNSPVIAAKIYKKNHITNNVVIHNYSIRDIDHHHSSMAKEHLRHDQLARIVKTLLYFESRLKNDQKNIRDMLNEKDKIINQQLKEILCIKKKYNDTTALTTSIDEVSQYCPKCRKNYYLIETKESAMQASDETIFFRERKISPSQSVEFASSSEEPEFQPASDTNSFANARRSKKYTSKKTSGTFREYLKSRYNNNNNSSSSNGYDIDANTTTPTTTTNSDQSEGGGGGGEGDTMSPIEMKKKKLNESFSSKILNLHGIKTQRTTTLSSPQLPQNDYEIIQNGSSCKEFVRKSEASQSKMNFEDFNGKVNGFEPTDDWYASASDVEDSDNSLMKPYGHNAVNPVLECVNQILLQQSMDGLLDTSNNPNEGPHIQKNQTLPRTKRVHFSTQNSMVQVPRKKSPPPPPPTTQPPTPLQLSPEITKNEIKNPTYDVQSIYSNEYEPIGSEHNSSNYYIDMESKLGLEDAKHTTNIRPNNPPDLPPKPPNLMKFKKPTKFMLPPHLIKTQPPASTASNASEPDYCSISEIQEIVASVQTVAAEVHKGCDEYSSAGDDTNSVSGKTERDHNNDDDEEEEDSFSDVPKLPNVAEIVSPKKDSINRFITQDNYITKSPLGDSTSQLNIENQKEVEAKKTAPPISPKKPKPPPKIIKTAPSVSQSLENVAIIADKTQIQAEFDWYNLDAEYGKNINQPDVIRETDPAESELFLKLFDNCSESSSSRNSNKVEYNLDEEFSLLNQPDIIKKIPEYDSDTKSIKSNIIPDYNSLKLSNTVNYFLPASGETPKLCRSSSAAKYETFLEESGLSSKPIIPRRKRVYYSGPFV